MPFSNSNSLVDTDANNMLRGLFRDMTNRAVTGTTSITDLGSVSVTGGTITATGCLYFMAAGTITGVAGAKTIQVDFGATSIITTGAVAGSGDWYLEGWIFNTATGAQRIVVRWSDHSNATNHNKDYTTSAIDTTASVTLRVRGTLANAADTITETMFFVGVQQIT